MKLEYNIYLDYNATTPIGDEVAEAMRPYLKDYFGNPSSSHSLALQPEMLLKMLADSSQNC